MDAEHPTTAAVIRPVTLEDVPALAHVHVATWRTAYRGIVPDDYLAALSVPAREERWRSILTDPENPGRSWAAVVNGAVVGFVSGGPERNGDPQYTGEIYALYLLEEYHGRGIGKQLVRTLVGWLREQGHASLLVWVLTENPARHFYEHLGGRPYTEEVEVVSGIPLRHTSYVWEDTRSLS